MEEDDLKHVPFGEMGKGVYSDATKGCFLVFDRMSADVIRAVQKSLVQRRELGLAEQTPYRVADSLARRCWNELEADACHMLCGTRSGMHTH